MSKKLSTLIPNTILSPFNRVLYDNIIQPYVDEKTETVQNRNVSTNRNDYEDIQTSHIDANISQYQPIISDNDTSYSFYDLVSLMQRYGINVDDFDQWGQCNAHSLNLPINYDKFVNYNKYGWVSENTPNYIVIRKQSTQNNEILIENAKQTNNDANILAAKATLLTDLIAADPLGGFDENGFDTYNFDGAIVSNAQTNDWEGNNRWVHVDDILPGTSYQLGTFPIIEYSNTIKMVEWIKLVHVWTYRESVDSVWEQTTDVPTLDELRAGQRENITFQTYQYIVPSTKRVYVSNIGEYNSGDRIVVNGSSIRWTIDAIGLNFFTVLEDNFSYFRFNESKTLTKLTTYDVVDVTSTEIVVIGNVTAIIGPIVPTSKITIIDFFNNVSRQFKLISATFVLGVTRLVFDNSIGANVPTIELNGRFTNVSVSSQGDFWNGMVSHWCYKGIQDAIVYPNQTTLPKTIVSTSHAPDTTISIIELGSYQPNSNQQVQLKINGKENIHFSFGVYESLVFTEAINEYQLINAIKLDSDLITSVPTTIVIEIGNDSVEDSGYNNLLVRTSETDPATHPVCLNFYKQYNQHQTSSNMYPLFEAYSISSSPEIQQRGVNILRFDERGDEVTYSQEIQRNITTLNSVAVLTTDMLDDTGAHYQISTTNGYKHIWSNNNTRTIAIEQVDDNGHPSINSGIWKCPEYLYGNINNISSNMIDITTLNKHFNYVNDANNNYRSVVEQLIQNNQPNNITIYDTMFPGIINQLTNTSLFGNILDAHKQMRLFYISVFVTEIINTISTDVLINQMAWFDAVLNQIRTYDQLKATNHNEFLHPLTTAMLFSDKKNLPYVTDSYISTHDNQLIDYLDVGKFVNQAIINSPFFNIQPQPIDGFIYLTTDNIYEYDGLTSSWIVSPVKNIILNLWKMLEDGLYSLCNSTVDSVGLINQLSINKSLKQKYIQYSNMKDFTYPYSNRAYYSLSNPFTWMYTDINLADVISPLPSQPLLTMGEWGASWKEIYHNLYGTHVPHIEPWKIQGYSSKPTWWDTQYDGTINNRAWLPVMWTNILSGTVPLGLSTPSGGTGTGVAGQLDEFIYVPVNIFSVPTSDGFGLDEILPPYRSLPIAPTPTDLLVQDCVLVRNISFVDISKTNSVLDDFGGGTLQEWNWKSQIDYRYDELYSLYNSDPTIVFKRSGVTVVDGVEFLSNKLINNESFQQDRVSKLLELYGTYSAYYNKDFSKFDWVNVNHTMGILLGTYINNDNLVIDQLSTNEYSLVQKTNEFNTVQNISNFKITIQDVDNSVRNDLMSGYVFLVDSLNKEIHDVETMTSVYSDMQVITSETALIDGDVYNALSTGAFVTITWDFFTPEEFDEQNEFYVIKRGGNLISLCRSVKELSLSNYVPLPLEYAYGLHVGVVTEEFGVLNAQITPQKFKSYALSYNQLKTVSLPIILTGVQELLNFFDGYMKLLKKKGITEYDLLFPIQDDNFNRPLNYQFAKEMTLAGLYNDKNNRNCFIGNVYTLLPFNNNIYINSSKELLSLVQSFERQDLTLLHDRDGISIPTSNLIVFRHDPISIQTNVLIGGGTIYLSTSQDLILLNSSVCDMTIRQYPSQLNIISGTIDTFRGFVKLNNSFEYSFTELTNNLNHAYSNKPNSKVFTNNAYQQVGFVNSEWYSNVGMTEQSSFQFWKEMLQSKGSIESIEPFSKISNNNITVNEMFAIKRHVIGFDDVTDFIDVNLQNIKAVVQNSDDTCDNINLPNITTTFSNQNIDGGAYGPNTSYQSVGVYDGYELELTLNITVPFYNEIVPRFSGVLYSKTFNQSYHDDFIQVLVNNVSVGFNIVPLVDGYTVQVPIIETLINDITIITKNTITLSEYEYDSINTIRFDESKMHYFGGVDFNLIGKLRNDIMVGWSTDTKHNIDTLQYFDPIKGKIPGVDFIQDSDPFNSYSVSRGETNLIHHIHNINMVGKIWYKKSSIYVPFYNSNLTINERIDGYGKTILQDDGYYQFVQSSYTPQSWYDFVETDSTAEINGEPLSFIMKRTRLSVNDAWSDWIEQLPLYETHSAPYTTSVSIIPTIGDMGDVIYVYVDGKLNRITIKDVVPINVNISNVGFDKYTITFIIRPALLEDSDLVEYKREFDYYTNVINDDQYFYFWVKNHRNTSYNNAYNYNQRHYTTLNGLYGLLDGNLCVFNLNYSLQKGKLAVTDAKSTHSVWSLHSTGTDSQKITIDLWKQITNCFTPLLNPSTYGVDGIICSKNDLIYVINNIIVDNYTIIAPYIPAELIINNDSSETTIINLYYILPPSLVNDITKTILFSRPYDVSSLIIQTSQIELISHREIL